MKLLYMTLAILITFFAITANAVIKEKYSFSAICVVNEIGSKPFKCVVVENEGIYGNKKFFPEKLIINVIDFQGKKAIILKKDLKCIK